MSAVFQQTSGLHNGLRSCVSEWTCALRKVNFADFKYEKGCLLRIPPNVVLHQGLLTLERLLPQNFAMPVSNQRPMSSTSCLSTRSARLRQDAYLPASHVRAADTARGRRHDIAHPVQEVDVQPPTCRPRVEPLCLAIRFGAARRSRCRRCSRVDVHLRACVRANHVLVSTSLHLI